MVLDHDPMETGKKRAYPSSDGVERYIQPDICGKYYGQRFVVDTKLKENSYIDQNDVDKLKRDGRIVRGKPMMVHSGERISEV